jgi:hypothetical protein
MAGETKVAWIGAIAAVGCALISGYFTMRASAASDQATTVSTKKAATAVDESYDTTIKPFFDDLKARMDAMQGELTLLQQLQAERQHDHGPALTPPPTGPAPAAPKKLEVPPAVRFRSEPFMQSQRQANKE